jgi:hypothetical protein
MDVVEQTKVKHTHNGHTLRSPFEHQLNNKNQDSKIGSVVWRGVLGGGGWVMEGNRGYDGMW